MKTLHILKIDCTVLKGNEKGETAMPKVIGIDTGGTLTKVAYLNDNQELSFKAFPSKNLQAVKDWIAQNPQIEEIGVTGGKTELLRDVLHKMRSFRYIVEFEATLKGVRYLLENEGHTMQQAIVTNIGTGTSIHYMDGLTGIRVGGTGIGGGTLIGLAGLTTGITNYDEICERAANGERQQIDLLVKDIYEGMDTPIDKNLTASNFGKFAILQPEQLPNEDILASVQGLVGEVISTMSVQYAKENNTQQIIYIGSTLSGNDHLKQVIGHYTKAKKCQPVFLKDNGFAGAVGALLNIAVNLNK